MKKRISSRVLSCLLVLTLIFGLVVPASAQSSNQASVSFQEMEGISAERIDNAQEKMTNETAYTADQIVRASIVMEKESTIEAGFSTTDIAQNDDAMSYRNELKAEQEAMTAKIEAAIGSKLDVQWNLTLAANIISANIAYGDMETIAAVPGVKDVFVETQYEPCVVERNEAAEPNTATSGLMIGSNVAWAAGYTGAGSKVAVVDTGLDLDHQSFDASAFDYALSQLDGTYDLMDTEDIAKVLDQLNAKVSTPSLTAENLYRSTKVPFGYNYIDQTYTVIDHDSDSQGEHGSHVEGIAAANRFIPNGDGTFSNALETVGVQGVAPDAQIVVMKVFGMGGGAYDSDYMAAIEDAIILGCASVNLSLGSANPGFSRNPTYQELLDSFVGTDTVVAMSAGNSGHYAASARHGAPGYMYADDVSMHTGGSPGSYVNSIGVASVDNAGSYNYYFTVGDHMVIYNESDYSNAKMHTIAGTHDYVFIDGFGTEEDFAAVADVLKGKVAFCSRGSSSFYQKAEAAVKYGAIATVIYNNQAGTINMDLTDYTKTEPCVSITQKDGEAVRANSTPVKDENGNVLYYTGKMTISDKMAGGLYGNEYYMISSFSAYGVPGNLTMKPEITAPGGNIYSVNGAVAGGKAYESMSGTSMASPQVAGMAAVVAQYIRDNKLNEKTGLSVRTLGQSLLMSTAVPMLEEASKNYYPVLRQGAGLANVGKAVTAGSYIMMGENASAYAKDGKVKVELKDDPAKTGSYTFNFTLNNLKDTAQKFALSADLFTQGLMTSGEATYLDTLTTNLMANVTFTVDGKVLNPAEKIDMYDFNGDGLVNGEDVQAILDYVIGARTELTNAELADLNADGEITSYDAYLLLQKMNTGVVSLPAGGKLDVTVKMDLTDAQKAELNENYVNGAYVQGYVYAKQTATAEGEEGTTHSIPVLGFYGNWTDASMFEHATYAEHLYGETNPNYVAAETTNAWTIKYPGDSSAYYAIGNPYVIESVYPAGREAINADSTIYQAKYTMIRNAAATLTVITNEAGEVLYMGSPSLQTIGMYYYTNGGSWRNTTGSLTLNQKVANLGVAEGDRITVSFVAIPELYEQNGALTAEQIQTLISENKLGKGAYMSTSFTVDNTTPAVKAITKDMLTGNLSIVAQDNAYIATVQVLSKTGKVYANVVPEQNEAGEMTTTTLDLSQAKIGPECIVVVADYAGNEIAYTIQYGGEPEDPTGNFYGFTRSTYRGGNAYRWMSIDPATLYYYNSTNYEGTENLDTMGVNVVAAEYVDGYIYMATDTGALYVAEQGTWADYEYAGDYAAATDGLLVKDMAFNYQNNTLYALDAANNIYTMDLSTLEMTKVVNVAITNPRSESATYQKLTMMTIDDNGNFYVVNYGSSTYAYLYTFKLDQAVEGQITDLAPIVNEKTGNIGFYGYYGSLAYDHDNDVIYMAASSSSTGTSTSYLLKLDPVTGKGEKVNTTYAGGYTATTYGSRLYNTIYGLYIVPSKTSIVKPAPAVTSFSISKTEAKCLPGSVFTLNCTILPWNLTDKTVTWTTSDASVATVEDGKVTAVGLGNATITATTNAAPNATATCEVTVEKLGTIQLTGLISDPEGNAYWSEFTTDDPTAWKAVSEKSAAYISGTLNNEKIYVHDGAKMYSLDPDSFELIQDCGVIASSWQWSDAAPAPAIGDLFGKVAGLCMNGTYFELISPEEGTLSYWTLTSAFASDPMAALAYIGSGTYDYNNYTDCPALFYYVITESGELYKFNIFTYTNGDSYTMAREDLGNVGVNLSGVSAVTGGKYASMYYDQTTGYLILSAYIDGKTNQLYAISPSTQLATLIGDFGEDIWPVSSLYNYTRATELTVKMNPTTASIYAEDTVALQARVVPAKYQNKVTWSTSDATVATVDENGVVTGVKEGTATITATSVDVNDAGEHATATCVVTVKGLANVAAKVNAQIVTSEGAQWVTIDTATKTATTNAKATTTFSGAGAHDGKLYGTNSDFASMCNIWQIDPANGYQETMGSQCSGSYAIRDMTTAPTKSVTLKDDEGKDVTLNAYGFPAYIANSSGFYFLTDFMAGNLTGWNLGYYYSDLAAVTYMGEGTYTDSDDGTVETKNYYVLGADGTLYQLQIWPSYKADGVNSLSYTMARGALGNIGMEFDEITALTMTYVKNEKAEGLVIGYSNNNAELYYVDLKAETLSCAKIGNVAGATAISGMYSDSDLSLPAPNSLREGTESINSSNISFAVAPAEVEESVETCFLADQANGGTNATAAIAEPNVDVENNIVLNLTGKNAEGMDVASTNGLVTVTYDAAHLQLKSFQVHAGYKAVAQEEGKLTFAYANEAALDQIATLTFVEKMNKRSSIVIETKQTNDMKPAYTEEVNVGKEEPFAFTLQPVDFEGAVNDMAVFTVATNRENVTYQWQYSNNGGKGWGNSGAAGSTTASLQVRAESYRIGQMYRCVAICDGVKLISEPATIRAEQRKPIEITFQPADVKAAPGEIVQFTVKAAGDNLKYQWQFSNNGGKYWSNSSSEGCNTDTLSVTMYAYRAGQMYRCVITNGSETLISNIGTLLLK